MCADRFGWPPSVVDQESHLKVWAITTIDGVMRELRHDRQTQAPTVEGILSAGEDTRRRGVR